MKEATEAAQLEGKKPGETIKVKIGELLLDDRKISLLLPSSDEDQSWREHQGAMISQKSMGSLADKFKFDLTQVKVKK